jgi:isocitrate dehydrogenase (NAD+)
MGRHLCRSIVSQQSVKPLEPDSKDAAKVKCTLIPGDGVGPELMASTKEILSATGVPVQFEELFLRFGLNSNDNYMY